MILGEESKVQDTKVEWTRLLTSQVMRFKLYQTLKYPLSVLRK